jgi:hypothetical protein
MHHIVKFVVIVALLAVGCSGGGSDGGVLIDPQRQDSDNDGVVDANDALPNDPNESSDFDGDGVGDNEDSDDDNDGILDDADSNPLTTLKSVDVSAELYTEDPDKIRFPVKVLFAVDCSLSMLGTDPDGRRINAVRDFLNRYNTEDYPSVSFGVVLWSGNVLDQTRNGSGDPGYTRSDEELNRVLDNAGAGPYTDYIGAMSIIRDIVVNDIMNTDNQESGGNELARSKYIVCFLSDGPPTTDGGNQAAINIWAQVEELTQLNEDRGVGRFNFHTFFLSSLYRNDDGDDLQDDDSMQAGQDAEHTLVGMARRGNGSFHDFAAADVIDFIDFTDLRLTNSYVVKYILAHNYTVRPGIDDIFPDSDGDGLTDQEEITQHQTDPEDRDTDDDGLSDYFEIQAQTIVDDGQVQFDPLLADSNCQSPVGFWPDQDSDGLTDCEESIVKTRSFVADSDSDGIPDGIEMASGTNMFENSNLDTDRDGATDLFEIWTHTNVRADDPVVRERYAYHYSLIDHGLPDPVQNPDLPEGIRRYEINVSNISLMDTSGAAANAIVNGGQAMIPGDNVIRLYIAQVPEDEPDSPPVFTMAEATVNYHGEENTIRLVPADFGLIPFQCPF